MRILRRAFDQPLDRLVSRFVASAAEDAVLVEHDIAGSLAHVEMLAAQRIVPARKTRRIAKGLRQILSAYQAGRWRLDPDNEDVHMNVERELERLIGEDAACLHTGRSRNDQVALDLRLHVLTQTRRLSGGVAQLQSAILDAASRHADAIMPGYTHLQRAQPVPFAHVLHAFVEALSRDADRLTDASKRAAFSPLGAAALAGSSLPLDPIRSAGAAGLRDVFRNSLDAVSDRDFVAEFLFCASLLSVHLSQMAECVILWTTREFGFVRLPDRLTTGSSLMPQKKNPDAVELVRGKCGAVLGDLVNVMVTLKALPSGYNRDLQETKPAVQRVSRTLLAGLEVMALAFREMEADRTRMLLAATDDELMATDLAEYLVRRGVAFRRAHTAVSALLRYARSRGKSISTLSLGELRRFSPRFEKEAFHLLNPETSVRSKVTPGGTGPVHVARALKVARVRLHQQSKGG